MSWPQVILVTTPPPRKKLIILEILIERWGSIMCEGRKNRPGRLCGGWRYRRCFRPTPLPPNQISSRIALYSALICPVRCPASVSRYVLPCLQASAWGPRSATCPPPKDSDCTPSSCSRAWRMRLSGWPGARRGEVPRFPRQYGESALCGATSWCLFVLWCMWKRVHVALVGGGPFYVLGESSRDVECFIFVAVELLLYQYSSHVGRWRETLVGIVGGRLKSRKSRVLVHENSPLSRAAVDEMTLFSRASVHGRTRYFSVRCCGLFVEIVPSPTSGLSACLLFLCRCHVRPFAAEECSR